MQAVILAGGMGTRLWPITREIPKPMVPVAGVPYLEHQIRLLARQGVTDLVLLIGYLGHQIEDYFGSGSKLGVAIHYSRESKPLGTGGALREARHLLAGTFLLIYGDSFLPIAYAGLFDRLAKSAARGVVVVYDNRLEDTDVHNNIAIDDDGLVRRYAKETARNAELTHVEAGVLAFRRSVVDLLPSSGSVSLEKDIYPALIARKELAAYVTDQRFYDIGTPARLETIERLFSHDYYQNALPH